MGRKPNARLGTNATIAASAVVRRLALMTTPLGPDVMRAQIAALRAAGKPGSVRLSVCTGCCSLCTSPKGDAPPPPGMRVNLADGAMICERCDNGLGLVVVEFVGKIVMFSTPSIAMVSIVVCSCCGVVTTVRVDKGYWGNLPVCAGCYERCVQSVTEPRTCFCGRSVGPTAVLFAAISDKGEDVVHTACYQHEHLIASGSRQAISDLQLLI